MGTVLLGKTSAERLAEESLQAREIVRQLTSELQLSQRQLLLIIHGLALNVEDSDTMLGIVEVVRSVDGLFLSDRAGEEDGKSDHS